MLGRYHLQFRVYDRKHTQTDVPANVTITVRELSHEAVLNSGSIRLSGITDEDFIRIWDYHLQDTVRSKIDKLRVKVHIFLLPFVRFFSVIRETHELVNLECCCCHIGKVLCLNLYLTPST